MTGRSKTVDEQIGERVFKARQAAGLTIEALAMQVRLPVRQMISLELGESRADAKTISNLAGLLGIEIRELFAQCCNMQYYDADQLISSAKRKPKFVALMRAAKAENFERRAA
ncbi:MAG: helix-turn-helix transcriptional regulator [Pseudomonadota bacterium]